MKRNGVGNETEINRGRKRRDLLYRKIIMECRRDVEKEMWTTRKSGGDGNFGLMDILEYELSFTKYLRMLPVGVVKCMLQINPR